MAKKKVVKKEEIEEVLPKSLTDLEMSKIDNLTKEIRVKELESLVIMHKKKILDLEFENERLRKHNEYKACTEKKESFLKLLSEKYELRSELKGYDPITG